MPFFDPCFDRLRRGEDETEEEEAAPPPPPLIAGGEEGGGGRTRIHVPYRGTKATQKINLEGTKPHDPFLLKALEKGEK